MVHPHLRGEYGAAAADALAVRRFTPTCVGNTSRPGGGSDSPAVHPHLRGEYFGTAGAAMSNDGSPPPAWGIRADPAVRPAIPRFTPTCVGNTGGCCRDRRRCTVHPHLRGEYAQGERRQGQATGSPPPAWGILDVVGLGHAPARFTPTCVGNTLVCRSQSGGRTVHPHLRGEYGLRQSRPRTPIGSPPPAWGIPAVEAEDRLALRFTPTCVGNTS